ncbi:PA14 domain-containing protein [Paraflavitalea speifideaquila]|uniref:PA14 domain-containing protein n=1 Tax=Paraflavitalea speifideaquila TaxID=3076558 RepID=UPI0028E5E948|nr:PA14 domain-containing protein [Paraflavitalea speifideiaquila]
MNLTRNVRIEGTEKGRAHLFIRSSKPQSILYTAFRYMGPRKDTRGSPATELIPGRYAMHFHYSHDGSRGSMVKGNVIRDTGNHSYVPHVSHGIQFIDNIAYNVTETAFWWDPGDPTHDVIYDHNIVAGCKFVPRSIDMNAEDAPTFSSSGFALNTGDGNICRNNVVVAGGQGDYGNGGAYNWEAVINEGVWIFHDNMAHNNHNALRVWQNSTRNHVIDDFIAYHNGVGIFHGAYANNYTYNGGIYYGNTLLIKAASSNSNRVRLENITVDGAGIIDHGIEVIHSPLPGDKPVFIRNVTIRGCKVAALIDAAAPEIHSTDLVQCNIEGPLILHKDAAAGETIRVQSIHGTPYQITQSGKTTIAPFAATSWGNGKGLKAEYYNGIDLTTPAMTRIDSNVSFTEWSTGVHYAITSKTYAVRWTGQVQAQFTEEHIFCLGSGGGHRLWIDDKLVIDNWVEHYPGLFKSAAMPLIAGERYNIKLEYFNTDARTGMGLLWTCPGLPLEYIPQSQLYA